jgi:hypothetical protein
MPSIFSAAARRHHAEIEIEIEMERLAAATVRKNPNSLSAALLRDTVSNSAISAT